MGEFSIWHWLIVLGIVVLVFGAGRLPTVMGDFAKGIKAFKAGMRDNDEGADAAHPDAAHPDAARPQAQVPPQAAAAASNGAADRAHDHA